MKHSQITNILIFENVPRETLSFSQKKQVKKIFFLSMFHVERIAFLYNFERFKTTVPRETLQFFHLHLSALIFHQHRICLYIRSNVKHREPTPFLIHHQN